MTTGALPTPVRRGSLALPAFVIFALRDLRGGLRGFYVLLACIALGVAVIAGVGALTDGLRGSFERQGRALLGGDAAISRIHVRASAEERRWLEQRGRVSEVATLRSMARRTDGSEQALVELKGVDRAYPLFGSVGLAGGEALQEVLRSGPTAAVDPLLLERLGLRVGDTMAIGTASIRIAALIKTEPDQIAERLPFGPRVLVSLDTLEATGLVQPGSLIRWFYRLAMPPETDAQRLGTLRTALKTAFPEGGFTIADRRDPSPNVTRTIERLRQFLTLIGLTSLLVGGIGVANAVGSFIDRKRKVIATFKSLGATSRLIFRIFLTEVLLVAGLAVLIGLGLGYLLPLAASGLLQGVLPISIDLAMGSRSMALAAAYGLLVALVFVLWPIGRAELVKPTVLFRDEVGRDATRPRSGILIGTAAATLALVALAVATSDAKLVALWFCLGLMALLAVFFGLGHLIAKGVRRLPRARRPELALALGNIGGPDSLTRAVVLSLGAGLSLLVAVALANASIVAEMVERLPANAPTYYVLDITKGDWPAFSDTVARSSPGARVEEAPMLRGRLVTLAGRPVEEIKAPPEAQWVLNGDRGLTFAEDVPPGSRVVAGTWWEKGYAGEPLVSFEAEIARKLGLKIGDTVTANVLGRNITARIANLREIKWENLTINFVLVFSPNTLKAAPYNLLATITLPSSGQGQGEGRLVQSLSTSFPTITTVRVKDAIDRFNSIFSRVMTAVQVSGGVTLISGAVVLAGALATAHRRRIYQAVLLKTLGATQRRILAAHLIEYLILATLTALIATLLGSIAAWIVVTRVMELELVLSAPAVLQVLVLAIGLVLAFGLAGTWRVLQAPAVPYLRGQ